MKTVFEVYDTTNDRRVLTYKRKAAAEKFILRCIKKRIRWRGIEGDPTYVTFPENFDVRERGVTEEEYHEIG